MERLDLLGLSGGHLITNQQVRGSALPRSSSSKVTTCVESSLSAIASALYYSQDLTIEKVSTSFCSLFLEE
jgi:hypothetical protein